MPPTADTAPKRKLSRVQVRIIRRVYATGEVTQAALAVLFGVAEETVLKIINRETWRDM